MRSDTTVAVDYVPVRIEEVIQITGGSSNERLVVFSVNGERRRAFLYDPLIWVAPGTEACVERRTRLLRPHPRHSITFPFLCNIASAGQAGGAAEESPPDGLNDLERGPPPP